MGAPTNDPPPAVRAVVAGHGTFATGLISAVDQITGMGGAFTAVSNTGLCREDIQAALGRALDASGARVVFTDLPAGSCTMVVRRLLQGRGDVVVVTGANVPLLLDFVMQPPETDPVVAVREALARAQAAMRVHAG